MRIESKIQGGYASAGGVLLRKGENVFTRHMTKQELAFLKEMERAKLITILEPYVEPAPESGMKLKAAVEQAPVPRPKRKRVSKSKTAPKKAKAS